MTMNNTQLYLSIGVPSFLVILAWLSNRSDNGQLRTELRTEIARLSDKVDRNGEHLRAEMDRNGEHLRAEIDRNGERLRAEIDKSRELLRADMIAFRKEVHADLMMLHERVVKVETKQENS